MILYIETIKWERIGKIMSWLESLIYGLVSGFSEFLPISSRAHQDLMLLLFGVEGHDPIRDMLVHATMLFSIYSGVFSM